MSEKKANDSKNSGWNDWAMKKSDWDMCNSKRPKLDIHRSTLSQVSCNGKPGGPSGSKQPVGRGGSFRRTPSMPTTSSTALQKDDNSGSAETAFFDRVQEEFDALEAKALAEAAAAIEEEFARSQLQEPAVPQNAPSTSKKPSLAKVDHKKNGSSGFENLFLEELAEEDIEECMLLASQEIQASEKNCPAAADVSFSQAYRVFAGGVDVHSSVLDTDDENAGNKLKKPVAPSTLVKSQEVIKSDKGGNFKQPIASSHTKSKGMPPPPTVPQRFLSSNSSQPPSSSVNLKAEAEVRRLSKVQEENIRAIKNLKDSLRAKEGETAILRLHLKQVVADRDHQKSRNASSALASEKQYKEKLSELQKELQTLKLELQFQKAESNAAKERFKVLSTANERVRIVEPQSSSPTCLAVPPKTPNRQRHVSSFLNRSTFEDNISPNTRPTKRPRLQEEEQAVPDPVPIPVVVKPDTRSVGEQTSFVFEKEIKRTRKLHPVTLGQHLSRRLIGIQLASFEFSNIEFWRNDHSSFDEEETIPTLSLLKVEPKSRQRCGPLDDTNRPSLTNCSNSLKHLMTWDEPTMDCPATRAAICQIVQECSGILHYNLLLLQDIRRPSDRELRNRDSDIITRGLDVLPLGPLCLLDEKQWYKEEYGVEMRRCLGILSEIAEVSSYAASLVAGAFETSDTHFRMHKFTELPEYSFVKERCGKEDGQRYYILQIFCDICSFVVDQKLTIAFNGVLVGILTLLRNCAQHNVFEERGQSYILDVIRCVLIARPACAVLLSLVKLLSAFSSCPKVMRGLCVNCDDEDNVVALPGISSFTRDTCPLQVLCIQLQAVTKANLWKMIDSVSEWLVGVVGQGSSAPTWILSSKTDSHLTCCVKLTCCIVHWLWDAFEVLQEIIEKEEYPALLHSVQPIKEDFLQKSTLLKIMRNSIIILYKLIDNNMFRFMFPVEGIYELLVQGIERLRKYLLLTPCLERHLDALLRSEQDTGNSTDQITLDDPKVSLYSESITDMLSLS